MVIAVCVFTKGGEELFNRVRAKLPGHIFLTRPDGAALREWTGQCFERRLPILFIGAAGIAVRSIAPFVKDKLQDSPVLVMDEKGQYVIPLLSGHMGGANELAEALSWALGAVPVITTATDVREVFSVDVFAVRNSLEILDRAGIQRVSSRLLETAGTDEKLKIYIAPEIAADCAGMPSELERTFSPADAHIIIEEGGAEGAKAGNVQAIKAEDSAENAQITEAEGAKDCLIRLRPKHYVLGMGCRKGKSFEELKEFAFGLLDKEGIPVSGICALASIDIKADEVGLNMLAQYLRVPFETFAAEELAAAQGEFSESVFVNNVAGVGNVCERAAVLGAQRRGAAELKVSKQAENGMTAAIAYCPGRITVWET